MFDKSSYFQKMSAFDIFIVSSSITLDIFDLTDVATLKCVSKHIKTELDSIYKCEKMFEKLIVNEYKAIGCVCTKNIKEPSALKNLVYLKHISRVLRLYNNEIQKTNKNGQFVGYLKEFTACHVQEMFIGFKEISTKEQTSTVISLIQLMDSKHVAVKIIIIYLIFYFLTRLYKHNSYSFLTDKSKCVLANSRLQKTINERININIADLKDSTTIFPFIFIDKVLRIMMEMRRYLAKF